MGSKGKERWFKGWARFEQYPGRCWGVSALWLALLCGLSFFWLLGSTGLVDETEPLFAEAARQMVETGDWITPYFNGETRFDKPPLVYWLMAIAYQLLGVNAWAARLPSAIAATALTVGTFFTLRAYGFPSPEAAAAPESGRSQRQRWLAAWIGSALVALNAQTIVWARTGVSDMLLSGCIGLALLSFFWGYAAGETQSTPRLWPHPGYIGFYIATALAVLTKGPVGIVLPGLTLIAFSLYLGRLRLLLREAAVLPGLGLFFALTLPWYGLVTLAHGQAFIGSFFGYHNLERFTQVVNRHAGPIYFYVLVVLVGFLPWSLYLPLAIARLKSWQPRFWRAQPRTSHLSLLAIAWFATIFLFFTVAVTKLPSYVLPLLPAAAILVALAWSQVLTRPTADPTPSWGLLVSGLVNLLVAIALAIAAWQVPALLGYDPMAPNLPEVLAASGLPQQAAAVWLAVAIALAILLLRRPTWPWLLVPNLLGFLAFLLVAVGPASLLADRARQQPLRQLAIQAATLKQPQEEIWMIGFQKPTVVFYSQERVRFFSHAAHGQRYLQEDPAALPPEATLLLLTEPAVVAELGLQPGDYQALGQRGAYQLLRVSVAQLLAF